MFAWRFAGLRHITERTRSGCAVTRRAKRSAGMALSREKHQYHQHNAGMDTAANIKHLEHRGRAGRPGCAVCGPSASKTTKAQYNHVYGHGACIRRGRRQQHHGVVKRLMKTWRRTSAYHKQQTQASSIKQLKDIYQYRDDSSSRKNKDGISGAAQHQQRAARFSGCKTTASEKSRHQHHGAPLNGVNGSICWVPRIMRGSGQHTERAWRSGGIFIMDGSLMNLKQAVKTWQAIIS